jgi:hypothetical protein
MIELSNTMDTFDVQVSATIGVHRTVRVQARGEGHAREVAKNQVKADLDTHDWVMPSTGQVVTVAPEFIAGLLTGMQPKKIEADAHDRKGTPLFIGDDITYVRKGKVRTATINDVFDGREMLWCDDSLFSINVDEVTKA